MKNLKKVLSLVLALAMALSLMTVAFAADASDYSDYDEVTYKEAVDVMTATGVFDGMGGEFNPTGTLTREQAAKIITYMLMGKTAADKLTTTIAPYSDVPASRWSAGAIAYCTNEGILSGVGNNKFNPTGELTGLEFSKMLLVALGYDAEVESLVGASWAINAATMAIGTGLDDGMEEVSLSNKLTREQACQMAFNTMKSRLVAYGTKTSINVNGAQVSIGNNTAYYVTTDATSKIAGAVNGTNYTEFAEKYCTDLALTHPTDAFERPTNTWKYGRQNIGEYVADADLTYTEEVKVSDIYSDLGLSANLGKAKVDVHVDGATEAASGTANDGTTALDDLTIYRTSDVKIGGNGILTEVFYDQDNNSVVITMIKTYAGEVSAVRAATSTTDASITVAPLNATRGGNFETDGYSVDDVVAYTYSYKAGDIGIQSVAAAEQVTGELSAYSGESVTVGGTPYPFNAAANISATELRGAVDNNVTLTLDQYGNVLDVDASAAATNYAVVLKYEDASAGRLTDARAELLFTDGRTERVNLDKNYDKLGTGNLTEGDIVSYTVNKKDQYVLTVLNDATTQGADATMVTKGNATMDTAIDGIDKVNGKTIFLIATDNNGTTMYTAYTGIANVPTVTIDYTDTAIPMGIYAKNGTVADIVYINASYNNSSVTSSTKNVVFVLGDNDGPSYDSVKGEYYTYDAIVNGEITTIETSAQHTTFAMYNTIAEDANGVLTLSNQTGITSGVQGTERETNGSITLGGNVLSYADDCQVFYIDVNNNISVSSISGIVYDETDLVWYKVVDNEVTSIVIQEKVRGLKAIQASGGDFNVTVGSFTGLTASYSANTFTITGTGTPAEGDTIVFTPAVSDGATANSVTLTYDGAAWNASTTTITVTAENGSTTDYDTQTFTVRIS